MAKQSTSKVQCTACGANTIICHYMKYFTNNKGKIKIGGDDIEGPFCVNCYNDIHDQALGKPDELQKEHEFVKTHTQKKTR